MTFTQLKEKIILLQLRFTLDKEKRNSLVEEIEEIWCESRTKTTNEASILGAWYQKAVANPNFLSVMMVLTNILLAFLMVVTISLEFVGCNN